LRLVRRPHGQPEGDGDGTQQILRIELRGHQLRGDQPAGIDLFQQASHQRRLAGADLASDDDEAFALVDAVLQVGEGALVAAASVEERRIGVELEGLAGEPEESLVHAWPRRYGISWRTGSAWTDAR